MMEKPDKNRKKPAYLSFKTVENFIDRLASTTIPPVIDKSLLSNMSGSARSQLMSALRFFDLIGDNDAVTEKLRTLVKAYKTEAWKTVLYDTLEKSYRDIVGDLDLTSGTDAQLQQAFKVRGGVEGHMQINAIRFYLSFLKEAGIAYSPHFGMRKAIPRPAPRKKSAKKAGGKKVPPSVDSGGFDGLPDPISGLLKGLPTTGAGWTKEKRQLFMTTFGAVLDFCYPVRESEPLPDIEEYSDKQEND